MNQPSILPTNKASGILGAVQNPCILSLLLLVLVIVSTSPRALATTAVTNSDHGSQDPLLRAMQQELDREKALTLPGMQRPYFIE